jgi:hypothetical protein
MPTLLLETEVVPATPMRTLEPEAATAVPRFRDAVPPGADHVLVDCLVCGRTHPPGSEDDPGCR